MHRQHEGDGEVMGKSAISSTENGQETDSPVIPQEIKDRWEREQIKLKQQMILEDSPEITKLISCCNHGNTSLDFFIGGVDISFIKGDNENACAALVVLNFPQLEIVYTDCEMIKLTAPYIPGFLAFREASFLLDMYDKLKKTHPQLIPQVIMVDGNGLLHPREFGLACHLGVLLDTPCIGVAKKLFQVDGLENNEEHHLKIGKLKQGGDTFPLIGTTGKILGKALRSCDSTSNPVYISTGHRVTLNSAVELVHKCCKHRVPEPTRQADIKSREYLRDNFIYGHDEHKNQGQKKQKTKIKYVEKEKEETRDKCKPINNVEELFESSGSLFDEDNT